MTMFRVTDLKQFEFCPRLIFYHYCWPDVRPITAKMVLGKEAQSAEEARAARRSLKRYGLTEGREESSVRVESERLGLRGIVDLVIETLPPHPSPLPGGEGTTFPHPSPLPGGEGTTFPHPSPLPGGEGTTFPHPSPLPGGEGTTSPHPSPLPGGEGTTFPHPSRVGGANQPPPTPPDSGGAKGAKHELIPVDYKLSTRQAGSHFKLQLLAYGWMLAEMRGVPSERGFLYSIPKREAVEVKFTAAMRSKLEQAVATMKEVVLREQMPAPTTERDKCGVCEFRRFCNDV